MQRHFRGMGAAYTYKHTSYLSVLKLGTGTVLVYGAVGWLLVTATNAVNIITQNKINYK